MSKYVYIGRVEGLNLLRIGVVEFVPHKNREQLQIRGVEGKVELLYERPALYDFLSVNDIKRYQSPLGNNLYNISLEAALGFIAGRSQDEIEFYKGEDVAKKQILEIERKQILYIKTLEEEKLLISQFSNDLKGKGQELDLQWKIILEKYAQLYKIFSSKFSLVSRIFGGIITTTPWWLEYKKREELVEVILNEAPHYIQIKCSDRIKTQLDLLIEPAIPFEDQRKITLKMQRENCQEIVSLEFAFWNTSKVGEKAYVQYVDGKCTNCSRDHKFSFPEGMSLLYYRKNKQMLNEFLENGFSS